MNLNGKTMAAVAMMVGLLGATGCNALNSASADPIAPEENAASAPVENENGTEASATPGVENYHYYGRTRYYAPHAPPATRYERVGRSPSSRHFWVAGYYRWNGRQHVWYPGRWEVRRSGYEYVGPRWVFAFNRWEYIPGHWVRR